MTETTTGRLTDTDLDEIGARAAALYEYGAEACGPDVDQLADTDVPAPLAEVRRLRAVPSAPADRGALRDCIAEALISWSYRGQEPDPEAGILETVRANAYSRADAVLAVLPPPVDRAAVLLEAANGLACLGPEDSLVSGPTAWNEAVMMLRRMADEAQQPAEEPAS